MCVCLRPYCKCSVDTMSPISSMDACIKSSSAPVDTKPESPSPASSSLGADKTVCLSAYSQEGGGDGCGGGELGFCIKGYGGGGVGTVQPCLQEG